MTKEEVLQKANEYCSEKGYTEETLTQEFKDMFSDFFAKKYPEAQLDDETMIEDLHFNLNTAFSATSKGVTSKQKAFETKEEDYKRQIAELNKKLGKRTAQPKTAPQETELSEEIQEQLNELKRFKDEEAKKNKFKEVVKIAKGSIRQDLHKSFEAFAKGVDVVLDKEDNEQAKSMVARFQEIFKDSIGDIKPLAPKQIQKRDDEVMSSLKRIKV